MELLGKEIAGRYQIRRPLGENGYSVTYKAYDDREAQPVVLKLLDSPYAHDPHFLKRLRPLTARLADLVHFNIVPCQGFQQLRDYAFWVWDYVDGLDLAALLDRQPGPWAWPQAMHIAQALGAALQYAHSQGLYHGNVKPSNVLIQEDGCVLLADFGIARAVEEAADGGIQVGTTAYLAPEQLSGADPDATADVYALAAVLYEILAGKPPFSGERASPELAPEERILWEKANALPPSLLSLGLAVPRPVDEALTSALDPDPAKRPSDIAELLSCLTGQELPLQYPPIGELARLVGRDGGQGSETGPANLRQAASRLVAFLSDNGWEEPAGEEPLLAEAPLEQATPIQAADADQGRERFAISWEQIRQAHQEAQAMFREAGAAALEGRWDDVTSLCQAILDLAPGHAGARILLAEAQADQPPGPQDLD